MSVFFFRCFSARLCSAPLLALNIAVRAVVFVVVGGGGGVILFLFSSSFSFHIILLLRSEMGFWCGNAWYVYFGVVVCSVCRTVNNIIIV